MINVQEAVEAATKAILNFYAGKDLADVSLEEVELSGDEKFWLITMGFSIPVSESSASTLNKLFTGVPAYERKYKVLKVDVNTGIVLSMKIREVCTEKS
jgi:hypothetical protein